MSENDLELDLMALADLGQPRKLALEIHRQIRTQSGSVPTRVPLHAIAKAVGIVAIDEFDTDRFEGTLVVHNGKGAIGLRRGLVAGRRNFTLGHELGHFLNPWHLKLMTRFECTKDAVSARRSAGFNERPPLERVEIEANEFSAALLLPLPEFNAVRQALGREIDVSHIRSLAQTFDVSQEFMAAIFVDQADSLIAVIHSQNGVIRRFHIPNGFPFLGLKPNAPLPSGSLTASFRRSNDEGKVSELSELPTDRWLARKGRVTALYEQTLLQANGWATTLLMVDEEEEDDDEEDDRDWNQRSSGRRQL